MPRRSNPRRKVERHGPRKAPTGIAGLDTVLGGGVPVARTTLVVGGPGSGKTLLALQMVSHAVRARAESTLVVAFEESVPRLLENLSTLTWNPTELADAEPGLTFVDARLSVLDVTTAAFDLQGLLAQLDARIERSGARHVVFDGVDVLLDVLDDDKAIRVELHRIHDWLETRGLTGIITAKIGNAPHCDSRYDHLQYLADCVISLRMSMVQRTALRGLQVLKVRGSSHALDEMPLVIGPHGLELMVWEPSSLQHEIGSDRVHTGIPKLDDMLRGGFLRGSVVMLSGAPGTSKSTLGGAFVTAACQRGERALLISFDESAEQLVQNMSSVGLDLAPHVASGLLRIDAWRVRSASAHEHALRIQSIIEQHQPRCVVIDPISALLHAGDTGMGEETALWLIDLAKSRGITTIVTSLLEGVSTTEATNVGVSSIADTWIHLSYVISAGERNRALTIVKARGTGHSDQVRELVLSDQGIDVVDVYTAEGAVLMGTLRWEREEAERKRQIERRRQIEQRRRELELVLDQLRTQRATLEREAEARTSELEILADEAEQDRLGVAARVAEVSRRRGAAESKARLDKPGKRRAARRSRP